MIPLKIQLENFGRFKNACLDFEGLKSPILVTGKNKDVIGMDSNGSGKTTGVMNPIPWSLFGLTPMTKKVEDVIREGESECCVDAIFLFKNKPLRVVRTRNVNGNKSLLVELDGNDLSEDTDTRTQSKLLKLLGIPVWNKERFSDFLNTVYLSSSTIKNFISDSMGNKDRINMLSRLFSLNIYDIASSLSGEKKSMHESELSSITGKIDATESQMANFDPDKEKLEIKNLEQEIEELEYTLNDLNTYKEEIGEVITIKNKIRKLNDLYFTSEKNIDNEIEKLTIESNTISGECLNLEALAEEKQKLEEQVNKIIAGLNGIRPEDKIIEIEVDIEQLNKEQIKIEAEILSNKLTIEKLLKELRKSGIKFENLIEEKKYFKNELDEILKYLNGQDINNRIAEHESIHDEFSKKYEKIDIDLLYKKKCLDDLKKLFKAALACPKCNEKLLLIDNELILFDENKAKEQMEKIINLMENLRCEIESSFAKRIELAEESELLDKYKDKMDYIPKIISEIEEIYASYSLIKKLGIDLIGIKTEINVLKGLKESFEEYKNDINSLSGKISVILSAINRIPILENKITEIKLKLENKLEEKKQKEIEYDVELKRISQSEILKKYDINSINDTSLSLTETDIGKTNSEIASRISLIQYKNRILIDTIKKNQLELKNLEEEKKKIKKQYDNFDLLKTGYGDIKRSKIDGFLPNFERSLNKFLNILDFNITIIMHTTDVSKSNTVVEKFNTKVMEYGKERDLDTFSSGERGRIALCAGLALREQVKLKNAMPFDFLLIDEFADGIDFTGCSKLPELFGSLSDLVIVITHRIDDIYTLFNSNIDVIRENGESRFEYRK